MRRALSEWGRKRWGSDVRIIHELQLGMRRIDLVFVLPSDIIGIEIKGPKDSPGDKRVVHQMREFNFYLPEVWLAVDAKWRDHQSVKTVRNLLVVDGDDVTIDYEDRKTAHLSRVKRGGFPATKGMWPVFEAHRDEMCCSRLLERLWSGEAIRILVRQGLVQEQLAKKTDHHKARKILARMLTGHQIMTEVCTELRARPLTGWGSDGPLVVPGPGNSPNRAGLLI